jgi:hypothetical protein
MVEFETHAASLRTIVLRLWSTRGYAAARWRARFVSCTPKGACGVFILKCRWPTFTQDNPTAEPPSSSSIHADIDAR